MRFILRTMLAGAAALSVTACASAPQTRSGDPFDSFTLEIEAGRWGAMNSQAAEIVGAPSALVDHPVEESDQARRTRLAEHLRMQVSNLEQIKAKACADGKLGKTACAATFKPAWAERKETRPLSWAELQKRSDSVGDAVMPVWDEICAGEKERAGPQSEDEMICPME